MKCDSVDPEVHSLKVTDITWTSVTLSWSVQENDPDSATFVHYRATDSDSWKTPVSATGTSYTVMSLAPGTEYQFFVKITSYEKSSSSQNATATTGKIVEFFQQNF